MTSTVLLTGATGFVGRQILRVLRGQGVPVRLIVRDGRQGAFVDQSGIEGVLVTSDLFAENGEWWLNACQNIDTVIHAAWYAEPGKYLQSSKNLDCLAGTLSLAKSAAEAGVRRWIGIGTCFEYRFANEVLSPQAPLHPVTPYAGAKAAAYLALSQWLPAQGVEFAWCRLFYLFGEGEDARRFVPYVRAKLAAGEWAELSSGNQIRDFLDVAEAGRMIAQVALGKGQGAFNICSGRPISVRQFAERLADEYGRRDLLKFGLRPDNLVDPPFVVGVPPDAKVMHRMSEPRG